jgi:Flp pilus assembly pilin Flp
MGMKLMTNIKRFVKDESGQTTTEYILILAVIVTIFMQFRNKLTTMLGKLFKGMDEGTEEIMNNDGDW